MLKKPHITREIAKFDVYGRTREVPRQYWRCAGLGPSGVIVVAGGKTPSEAWQRWKVKGNRMNEAMFSNRHVPPRRHHPLMWREKLGNLFR